MDGRFFFLILGGKVDPRTEAMLVWAPHPDLPESKVSEYCTIAKAKHGYNIEQVRLRKPLKL